MTSLREPRVTHRDRLVAAAIGFTTEHGWSALTMAKLADIVGVSRQTVYNELGTKAQLAEAMVMAELAEFLRVVDRGFERHPDDLIAAIEDAARSVLELARVDPLLHAVLSSAQGAGSDLLPLLTTNAQPLLGAATSVLRDHVRRYDVPLDGQRLDALIDMVVRLVLSHVMQPAESPTEIAGNIAWIAEKALAR